MKKKSLKESHVHNSTKLSEIQASLGSQTKERVNFIGQDLTLVKNPRDLISNKSAAIDYYENGLDEQ